MNGIINVLKPPAMSSSDVVFHIRRITGIKKAGHNGTLDPGAAGVLPVCLGRATKLADYLMNGAKEYIAELTLGAATDTLDSYGRVVKTAPANVTSGEIERILPEFLGETMQAPPAYSAAKHHGQPLYKLARKGIEIEKPARLVRIEGIDLLDGERNRFLLRVRCTKGTYIRTLLADLAERLGVPGYTSFLLRSESGGFTLASAHTFDEIETCAAAGELPRVVIPAEEAVGFMKTLHLPQYLYDIVLSGTPVDLLRANLPELEKEMDYAIFCRGELIGIGRRRDMQLKVVSMFKIKNVDQS